MSNRIARMDEGMLILASPACIILLAQQPRPRSFSRRLGKASKNMSSAVRKGMPRRMKARALSLPEVPMWTSAESRVFSGVEMPNSTKLIRGPYAPDNPKQVCR